MARVGGFGEVGPLGSGEPEKASESSKTPPLPPPQPEEAKPSIEKALGVPKEAANTQALTQATALRDCQQHIGKLTQP